LFVATLAASRLALKHWFSGIKDTHTAVTDWPVTETIRTSKGGGGRLLATHTAAIWLYMGWKFCSSTKAGNMAILQKVLQKLIWKLLWK